jgi:acetylornithine deacetylase/succinyl-diaminopimelate desuccinylase family protein
LRPPASSSASCITAVRQQVEDVGVNVVASLPGATDGGGLLFNGHLDTVPPSSLMPYPPYAAVVEDGHIWGRGTADMKGGLAAMACALAAVRAAQLPLRRPLTLAAVASEERGNLGTAALIADGIQAQWAVIGEATDFDLVTAHKGVDRYRVIVEGRAAHESMPERGINAIIDAARVINTLHRYLWPQTATRSHPQLGCATYNIGTIQGGTSRNTIPDRCVFQLSKRWLPGDSPDAIRAEIEATVAQAAPAGRVVVEREPEFDRIPHPPLAIAPDHPLIGTLSACVRSVLGREPALLSWGAFTDGALLQQAGVATAICGPGDVTLAHTDNEHIALSDIVRATELYAIVAAVVCCADDIGTR